MTENFTSKPEAIIKEGTGNFETCKNICATSGTLSGTKLQCIGAIQIQKSGTTTQYRNSSCKTQMKKTGNYSYKCICDYHNVQRDYKFNDL